MNKINKKIIIFIVIGIVVLSVLGINYVDYIRITLFSNVAEELILAESNSEGILFNQDLKGVERVTNEVVNLVENSFDEKAFLTESDYMERYKKQIEKQIEQSAQNAPFAKSAYVFFRPEMNQKPHDVWYADLDFDGVVERQEQFPLDYYDGDVKWKQWYYVPIATKKPYWTEPYIGTIESDQDLIYFSYTAPVIVNGKIIGVAGSDYYFNKMKESLDQYNLKRKSDVILVDKNFNILVHPEISSGVNLFSYLINVDQKSIQNMKSSELGRFKYIGNDKQGRIMFYKRLDNDWYLIFTMSEAVIKDSVIGVGNVRILILVLISLLIIGVLQIGLVRLIKPLNRIKDSLMRMTDDHYDLEMSKHDIMRRDEFGDMAKSVEQLRVVWQERFSQEKISHQEMESLIEEKTLELKKTNEFLELSLEQLQEQNAETNIATEKYEDQLIKMQMLQTRLFQSEQLASLSYILIGLAYDLNSPIGNSTTMISYLKSERGNMIRKFNDGQLKKQELDDFMTTLEESLELLDRNMTIASNQVIQFKRLSSGQSQQSKTEFKLKETLNSIFNQCLIGMDKGNLRINLMMPELLILSDLGAFIQVFSNLIRYSINHSYFQVPKGMIAIHGEVIDETSLLLTYEDFGNATSTSMLETAFVPYLTTQFQEQPQIVQLNICYHIITKIFEGSIRFESQGDEGNKFHMVLRVKIIERL